MVLLQSFERMTYNIMSLRMAYLFAKKLITVRLTE